MFKKFLSIFSGLLLLFSLCACEQTTSELRFGTGGTGGNYYAYGNVLANLLENQANLTIDVKATAGSAANLRLLQQGFLQMAFAQSDTLHDANQGIGNFTTGKLSGYSAIAGIYTEACQIIVTADSDIYSIADLVGKRVSVGEKDSGVTRNAEQLLLANGLTFDMLGEVQNLSFSGSAANMAAGELDAFFCTASAPTTAVSELAKMQDIRLLSLDERTIEQMLSLYDCYTKCVIPAETYPGQDEDVTTIGVKAVLLASDQLDNDTVKQITKVLFENTTTVQYATTFDCTFQLDTATSNIPIPFHPGAAAYFAEYGYEVNIGGSGDIKPVSASQDNQ